MNIDSLSKFADKYEYLIVLAALEDELMKLDTSDDNKDFIKNISDVKYKGKIFSFLRKNPKLSVQELKNQLEKEKAEDEKKEKLKESAIPPEWLPIINHLNTPEKLKVYLRALARAKKLPNLTEEVKHQLETVKNWLEENPDESIDNLTFQELFDTADEWLTDTQKTETTKYEKIEIVYGPEWKNKQFNGHYITTVTTENDLMLEGNLMSHCVGGYYDYVKEGSKKIFSLRSPSGKPLVTMDVSPDMYWFKQTFGYHNRQPNQLEMSMVNEWKQSLHPKDKIIGLSTGSTEDKIKSCQFMDYNDPEYKQIIDVFIQNEKDSGQGFLGHAAENDPKDVLQALAANETLSENCYEKIYQKCSNNQSTVFNLIRNGSIGSNLFRKLFDNHKDNVALLSTIASSIKMKDIDFDEEIIKHVLDFHESIMPLRTLLNNPSVKSSTIKKILNEISLEKLQSLFSDSKFIEHSDPKFIDDILESNNPHLKDFYFQILCSNKNLNTKILEKFYKKYGKKPIKVNRKDLIELNFARLADEFAIQDINIKNIKNVTDLVILINRDSEINLSTEQIDILLNEKNESINKLLLENPSLTEDQISNILYLGKNISSEIIDRMNLTTDQINVLLYKKNRLINYVLAKKQNLTPDQFDALFYTNEGQTISYLAQYQKLTDDQFNLILNKEKIFINASLALNKNLKPEQIDILIKKFSFNNYTITENIASSQKLTEENFNKLYHSELSVEYSYRRGMKFALSANQNLTPEQIDMLLNSNDESISFCNLASCKNLTLKQFNFILNKNYDIYNESLAKRDNLTTEQINLLLDRNSFRIDQVLSENKNLTPEQINLLIDRHHQIIQRNLIERKDLTKDNFYKLFIKMKSNIKSLSNDLQVRSYIKKFYGSKIPEKYSYVLSLANKFLKLARLNFA